LRNLEDLDPNQVGALVFARNAARSGIPYALLDMMFGELPPAYIPDPARLAFSFVHGWVEAATPPDPHEVITEHLSDWLEQLVEGREVDELETLSELVTESYEKAREDSDPSKDDRDS